MWDGFINLEYVNKELTWYSSDTLEHYNSKKTYFKPNSFTYKFNEAGYRCDSFNQPTSLRKLLFIGCSATIGVGIPVHNTWAYLISKHTNTPYWNLALGGRSSDYIARMLYNAIPALKPNQVIIYFPERFRKEIFINGELTAFGPWTNDAGQYLSVFNDEYDNYNFVKNLILIDYIMKEHNVDWRWGYWGNSQAIGIPENISSKQFYTHIKDKDRGRDGIHAGPVTNLLFAKELLAELPDFFKI